MSKKVRTRKRQQARARSPLRRQQPVDAPLGWFAAEFRRHATAQRAYSQALLQQVAPAQAGLVAQQAAAHAQDGIDTMLRATHGAVPIGCQRGCHWCCLHIAVPVSPPEALWMAAYLRAQADEASLATFCVALQQRVTHLRRLRIPQEYHDRRIPCLLLTEAGTCSVYAARPLACRAWASTDAQECRKDFEGDRSAAVKLHSLVKASGAAVALGMHLGMRDAGLDYEPYELQSALLVALTIPDASEQWHRGGRLFHDQAIAFTAEKRAWDHAVQWLGPFASPTHAGGAHATKEPYGRDDDR